MCRKFGLVGNGLMVIGIALLLAMIIPRCFTTVCIGVLALALGCFLCPRR